MQLSEDGAAMWSDELVLVLIRTREQRCSDNGANACTFRRSSGGCTILFVPGVLPCHNISNAFVGRWRER